MVPEARRTLAQTLLWSEGVVHMWSAIGRFIARHGPAFGVGGLVGVGGTLGYQKLRGGKKKSKKKQEEKAAATEPVKVRVA